MGWEGRGGEAEAQGAAPQLPLPGGPLQAPQEDLRARQGLQEGNVQDQDHRLVRGNVQDQCSRSSSRSMFKIKGNVQDQDQCSRSMFKIKGNVQDQVQDQCSTSMFKIKGNVQDQDHRLVRPGAPSQGILCLGKPKSCPISANEVQCHLFYL